ncbi:conserved hypothetical protein [Culex quinquefasciatus]|uniref:Uncharacterized protein n=1 Tax=Culex quinquefasciatus TaxID=7176 RepID=B0XD29_CULQU|nr:conserved hypothetical protein [Culex quinquefasciatus]|eukprot:XP_001867551.1 conserved hypothetical protein [Culex quinquefasciatus]
MPEGDNIQPDGNLLYERLLQQNERLEAQNARMMEMLERFNLQDVCAVKQDRDKPSPTTGSSSSDSQSTKTQSVLPPSPCWCCGDMHFVRDCAYKQHVCQDCMQTGHKEGYCSCVPKKSKNKQQTNVNSLYAANRVNSTSKRKFLTKLISDLLEKDPDFPLMEIVEENLKKFI